MNNLASRFDTVEDSLGFAARHSGVDVYEVDI
jgi:hypothetical protein